MGLKDYSTSQGHILIILLLYNLWVPMYIKKLTNGKYVNMWLRAVGVVSPQLLVVRRGARWSSPPHHEDLVEARCSPPRHPGDELGYWHEVQKFVLNVLNFLFSSFSGCVYELCICLMRWRRRYWAERLGLTIRVVYNFGLDLIGLYTIDRTYNFGSVIIFFTDFFLLNRYFVT
jgi:hypothetical protein